MQGISETLPSIREDLQLLDSAPAEDGSKSWILYDPLQNKYFTIGLDAFKLISLWEAGCEIKDFIKKINKKEYFIDEEGLLVFLDFISNNKLIKASKENKSKEFFEQEEKSKLGFFKWLLHNYLFIRVPLLKPNRWLEDNLFIANIFYSKLWISFVFILGFIGVVLSLRNWEEYTNTFSYMFSVQGAFYYLLSVIFVKSLHELGHAFTAKKYGANVPAMGVAFLVLFPVLYTDTTDSWRIKSKEKRLRIVMAGMKVEIYLALIATFLWSFLPDGVLKSIAFVIATTSWISSLLINISPFLRFDGYYALSDWTDTKNLQPRSFAMARWFIRRNILGSNDEVPEFLPSYKQNFFIVYAIATWIYRFFLFLGIAFLVYYFTFKVLGIFLFIIEIVWFILLPIYKELKIWFEKLPTVRLNRRNISSLLVLCALIALFVTPLSNNIQMPAVLEAKEYMQVHAPYKAKIKEINIINGQYVKKGDVLLRLESLENDFLINKFEKEIQSLNLELQRVAASKENLDKSIILEEEVLRKQKSKEGLLKIRNSLVLKADFDGIIYKNNTFNKNQWINPKEAIFTLYNPKSIKLTAFCEETDLKYIKINEIGKFILNSADFEPINTQIQSVSNISLPYISFPELTSIYGGSIPVRKDSKDRLISEKAYYKVEARLDNFRKIYKIRKDGILVVEGEPLSIVDKITKKAIALFIRESGF